MTSILLIKNYWLKENKNYKNLKLMELHTINGSGLIKTSLKKTRKKNLKRKKSTLYITRHDNGLNHLNMP